MTVTNTQKWETELYLIAPWKIDENPFKPSEGKENTNQDERHISLSYKRGAHFTDETGTPCPVYDTYNKTWRHLNYGKQRCYVHCKVPRIQTTEGKIKLINVPWARQGSGFTLSFEAHILHLISTGALLHTVCTNLNETLDRILPVFNYWVNSAYSSQRIDQNIDAIGIDEQSHRTGERHITTLVDLKNQRVLLIVEGKSEETLQKIKAYLESKGINPLQIKHISGDFFNQPLSADVQICFPNAILYWDRFYVLQHLNNAMDQVSSTERKNIKTLTKQRALFRTDPTHLSAEQKTTLLALTTQFPRIEKAYRLKILFNNLWEQKSIRSADAFLESWCHSVEEASLTPFKEFAQTLKKNKNNIINFTAMPTNTNSMENIHEKVHQIRSRKSGLTNMENFSNMVYLLYGKLSFSDFLEYTNTPH